MCNLVFYINFKMNKLAYISTQKVMRLLEEQTAIFNYLPDGAMIHKTEQDFIAERFKSNVKELVNVN